jgi:hypothetical protein
VVVAGGRKDVIDLVDAKKIPCVNRFEIADSLRQDEWRILAGILHKNGFCTNVGIDVLVNRLATAKYLLPAIYEATDRMNRKFAEIVAHEYRRYDGDSLIQRSASRCRNTGC